MKLPPLWLLALALASCQANREKQSAFGEPIFVNGRRVSDDEIKLALIYGPGRTRLDRLTTDLIIETEIAREAHELAALEPEPSAAEERIRAELRAKYSVSDALFESERERAEDIFRKEYPTLDLEAEIRRGCGSVPAWRDQLRAQLAFDRVFLPDNPAYWPTVAIEAVKADQSGGDVLFEDARHSYQARSQRAAQTGREIEREDPLYTSFLRQIVRDAVGRTLTIKTHGDGIASGLALWVDTDGDATPELECTIDELWNQVRDRVTEADVAEAKRWCVLTRATRQRLERDGGVVSSPGRRTWMAELDVGLAGIDELATGSYHFPSVEHFTEYLDLRKGFEGLISAKLADGADGSLPPGLAEYLPRAEYTVGTGMVDVELLLVSAIDIPCFRLKPNGWRKARDAAQALLARYERNPIPECWSEMLDANSEFWDYPDPLPHDGQQRFVCRDILKRGRFGRVMHADLVFRLQETWFAQWLNGECVADRICFEQAEGSVAGPFRGPLGWYLARLNQRIPAQRPLQLDDPRVRERLKDDYVRSTFMQYSKEAVEEAEIRGWKPL